MLSRPSVRSLLWKVLHVTLPLSLLIFSGAYALVGDELFSRLGSLVAGTVRRLSDASIDLRLRARTDNLLQAGQVFDDLLSSREALELQIRALEAKRAEVAARSREDAVTLRAVLSVLHGEAVPCTGQSPPNEVERDANEVYHRVQVHRSELQTCEAELARMSKALATLDRRITELRCALEHRADELQRQKVTHAGWRAYANGLELARRLEEAERDKVRQSLPVPNP